MNLSEHLCSDKELFYGMKCNKTEEHIFQEYNENKAVKELVEENNFPTLNNTKVNVRIPLIEYSKILKDLPKNNSDSLKDDITLEIPIVLNDTINVSCKNTIESVDSIDKNEINISLTNENLIKNEYNILKNENNFLNEKILKLQLEIKTIKDQLIIDLKKLDNKKIYEEMDFNEKEINTSVTKTFMNTHYSEYKIF
jgi:hypothetical protein